MSKETKAAVKKAEKALMEAKKAHMLASVFKGRDPKKPPKVGDVIYVRGSMSFDHGEDDYVGGLATVSEVKPGISAGEKSYFISFEEVPGHSLNWDFLAKEQDKLAKEYKNQVAYPDPDYNDYREPGEWKSV